MRIGNLKCSLFGLGLSNTIVKSTRLRMPILSLLKLDSLFLRRKFLRLPRGPPQAKPIVPRRMLLHADTSHPLVSPATQPLSGHIQNASNTFPEPHVLVVPTVPVVPTSVLQHETLGSLLAHPHPPSQLVSHRTRRAEMRRRLYTRCPCETSELN